MSKCRELNAELVATTAKISSVTKDAEPDETSLTAIRLEVIPV